MNQISIYLAGNIQKGHEKESQVFWSEDDKSILRKHLPSAQISFLNPALRSDDLSDQRSVFGRDMAQVYLCDFLLVDARERRGLGVGAEMMWAKVHRTPIITFAPENTHYRKESVQLLNQEVKGWVHPFIESLSDKIVDHLQEAAEWIDMYLEGSLPPIKDLGYIQASMARYKDKQYDNDHPMKDLINDNLSLKDKFSLVS